MGKKNKNKSTRKSNNARRIMKGFEELDRLFIEETTNKKSGPRKFDNSKSKDEKRKFNKPFSNGDADNTFKKEHKNFDKNRDNKKPFAKKREPISMIHEVSYYKGDNKKFQKTLELDVNKVGKRCTTEHAYVIDGEITSGRIVALSDGSAKPAIYINELVAENNFNVSAVIPVHPKNIIVDFFTRKTDEGREIICDILKVKEYIEEEGTDGKKRVFAGLAKYNSFKGFVNTTEDGEIHLDIQWKKDPFDGFEVIPVYIERKLKDPTIHISDRASFFKPMYDVISSDVDAVDPVPAEEDSIPEESETAE